MRFERIGATVGALSLAPEARSLPQNSPGRDFGAGRDETGRRGEVFAVEASRGLRGFL